ncbi:MAG: glycosyltransferase family 1 protein [Alphaproteobacteria bacterium]|nr:glycosyltransferase family 1 protein [Alphaproteobacteria bacterium]
MKKILIVTDNLADQINGVVTTYKNIEAFAILDGFEFVYITPNEFNYFDCPVYNEVKIAIPRSMGEKIKEIDPNYVHIATEGPVGLWARAYLTKHNLSYNTAYHTKFPEGLKALIGLSERITWRYIKWFHKHTGKVLTTTETMVKELKDHKLVADIIPWTRGVDRNIFNSEQRSKTNETLNLVCVSRISKEKNLDDFCKIDYFHAKKILVGDGPYREELQEKYPDVKFVGFKVGKDLAYYYANADVFVFPSRWETFGIVMIEAMACGTPVAAYPCQGPMEVVDQGKTGFLRDNLKLAITECLTLDRFDVEARSLKWSWEEAWKVFKNNLTPINKY